MLLCIETSGKNCSVALFEGLQLVSIREVHTEQFSHSENLHVFIEQVLKESNLQPMAIALIALGWRLLSLSTCSMKIKELRLVVLFSP